MAAIGIFRRTDHRHFEGTPSRASGDRALSQIRRGRRDALQVASGVCGMGVSEATRLKSLEEENGLVESSDGQLPDERLDMRLLGQLDRCAFGYLSSPLSRRFVDRRLGRGITHRGDIAEISTMKSSVFGCSQRCLEVNAHGLEASALPLSYTRAGGIGRSTRASRLDATEPLDAAGASPHLCAVIRSGNQQPWTPSRP